MTLLKINPKKDFQIFDHNLRRYLDHFPTNDLTCDKTFFPNIDIFENNDLIRIEAEFAGLNKNDIKVSIKENTLKIEGNKIKSTDEHYSSRERRFGEFLRKFSLPTNTDTANIDAKFENGLLMVELKKIQPKQPEVREIKLS